MRIKSLLLLLTLIVVSPVAARPYYVTPDVPTTAGPYTLLPWEIWHVNFGVYNSESVLASGSPINAVHKLDSGDWLLSVDSPTNLGGTVYGPEDVVLYDGVNFSLYFSGSAAGVPLGSNIDAVTLMDNDHGSLLVSFEVPTTIGPDSFDPADLVRFVGGGVFATFDASSTLPRPPVGTNVTGADWAGGVVVVTFEDTTTIGSDVYRPGELVQWDGTSWSLYYDDPLWPVGSLADGISLPANPGVVPILRIDKSAVSAGDLTISWTASCSSGATDYGIYEGEIGIWYSHVRIDCFDDGADRTEEVTPAPGRALYYLVVPQNAEFVGSFGFTGTGSQRPAATVSCMPILNLNQCP